MDLVLARKIVFDSDRHLCDDVCADSPQECLAFCRNDVEAIRPMIADFLSQAASEAREAALKEAARATCDRCARGVVAFPDENEDGLFRHAVQSGRFLAVDCYASEIWRSLPGAGQGETT